MQFIQTDKAPQAIGPYSQAVKVGDLLFTSGQIALTPEGAFLDGDVKAQSVQVLKNLRNVIEAGGGTMENVVKTTIFLANMDDFAEVNKIYEEAFGTHKPARSTVAVKTLPKNALIEIEAIVKI